MGTRRAIQATAERQLRTAVFVATLFGGSSLLVAIRTWHERRHLDLELLLGFLDAIAVLGLAYLLTRRSRSAALLLLLLALVGMAYTVWRGLPGIALLPHVVAATLYGRAIPAAAYLRDHASSGPA